MKNPVWLLKWILKAAIFFTLFAFALNNQQEASVHFFFGNQWRSPMVLIVLAAFAIGLVVGAPGMARCLRYFFPPAAPSDDAATPPVSGVPHGL